MAYEIAPRRAYVDVFATRHAARLAAATLAPTETRAPYSKYTRTPFNEYTGTHGNNTGTVRTYSW